jgi:uncharacterized protein
MDIVLFVALSVLVVVLFLVGIAGSILPGLPGTPLIVVGAFLFAFFTNFEHVGLRTVVILAVISLVVTGLSYAVSSVGAKMGGASFWGILGAFVGAIAGFMIGNVLGFIVGPFLGAALFELLTGKSFEQSFRSGAGSVLGFFGGAVIQLAAAVSMVVIFIAAFLG